jgi:riboflavin synthase
MFTGIVTAIGRVESVFPTEGGLDLGIAAPYPDLELGESIAVDGACLTVVRAEPTGFAVHVVPTSLARTRFSELAVGDGVNLERALRAGDRLGGHIVQGHVDGLGTVEAVQEHADARLLDIRVPPEVANITIPLGSITVDGVSLTVNALRERDLIQVSLIPFTLQHTTLGSRRPGDRVHLEGDTIGKYVKALTGR